MYLHPQEVDATTMDPPRKGEERSTHSRRQIPLRRRLVWACGIVLLLALLAFTPPLVNANRYRGKIAESMSRSLGRPVHLDGVSMHLLPVPGFTLQNLVVSEDPAFGTEPTIRANTVEASLRVSSLWQHPVEFSSMRFVEPSVNLVRNAQGRWNLSDVLLHASRLQSAPTVQRRAGPTPRFPYIEATGGRVNVKLGAEKLPFSLTEADFALWLSSPQQWRVRLVGQPARTDTNLTDPGRLRVEGELRRAEDVAAVPVNFTASWHDVPLGEATRMLAGDDWGWRGTLNLDAALTGTLGDAHLASKLTLGGLRRAEFVPAHPLDLQVTCGSQFAVHPATLTQFRCFLPDDAPQPLLLSADMVHPQDLAATNAAVQGPAIPVRWALLWAALFSPRVRTDLRPGGTIDVDVARGAAPVLQAPPTSKARDKDRPRQGARRDTAAVLPASAAWTGTVRLRLPAASNLAEASDPMPNDLLWEFGPPANGGTWPTLRLAPTPVTLSPGASITLAGSLGQTGYQLAVNGSAATAALLTPARYLPELGDGLEAVIPFPPTGTTPERVQLSCSRSWDSSQRCTGPELPNGRGAADAPGVPTEGPGGVRTPPLVTPRSLSPLERAPFSTPRPPASQ